MSFEERVGIVVVELFGVFLGALFGVYLGLMVDNDRKHNEHLQRIKLIAPKICEEFRSNLDIYSIWKNERSEFWRVRYRYKNIRQEAYKEDLWKWSLYNDGKFPLIYETIQEINFYLDQHGDNPQFGGIRNKLMIELESLLKSQPEPFRCGQTSD